MKIILSSAFLFILIPFFVSSAELPRDIPVRNFTPVPIRITLESLPKPYATESRSNPPEVLSLPEHPLLNVPEGFRVSVYARGLERPRWLALSPEGDVLVTETRANRIRRLRDINHDGVIDEMSVFAESGNGLKQPFGMAFDQDFFFLGNTDAVMKFSYRKGQGKLVGKGDKIAELPGGGYNQHWTRNVILSPDGAWLYVSVGSASNASREGPPRASILRMRLDGSEKTLYARGMRNPIGLAFHPVTHRLYATVNERDRLGDDLVPDYFTEVKEGAFYGWPYAYLASKNLDPRLMKQGKSDAPDLAARTVTPDVLFESHSAVMGAAFPSGGMFPPRYQQGAFVAMRGSWNRRAGTGYKIVYVPFDAENRPRGYYEDFVTGFLIKPDVPLTWGRPVGVLFLADGSLIFAEEENGRIFRVYYDKK